MARLRSEVGFWSAVGGLHLRDVFSIESITSAILGVGLAAVLAIRATVDTRVALSGTFTLVTAAFVAIVFAGLALVVSLLSEIYLRLLRSGSGGLMAFFRPFILAIGTQIATIVTSVIYGATAALMPRLLEPWAFGIVAVLFFASCFEIVVLTRSVLMHALLRSKLGEVVDIEAKRGKRGA